MTDYQITYDFRLFARLHEVFPEAFTAWHEVEDHEYEAGPWGIEETVTGTSRSSLAESILCTAKAYTRGGTNIAAGLEYIDMYKSKRYQRQALRNYPLR